MVAVAELVPAVTAASTAGAELLRQRPACEQGPVMRFHCESCGLAEAEGFMPFMCPLE